MAIDPKDQEEFVALMQTLMQRARFVARIEHIVGVAISALVLFLAPFLGLLCWNALPGPNIGYLLAFFIETGGLFVYYAVRGLP